MKNKGNCNNNFEVGADISIILVIGAEKKSQQVTWTKFGLHNYPKTLHYGLHQVRIEHLDINCLTGYTQKNVEF